MVKNNNARRFAFLCLALWLAGMATAQTLPQGEALPPKEGGSSRGGFGISIDLGTLFGAIREAVKGQSTETPPPLAKQALQVSPVAGGG